MNKILLALYLVLQSGWAAAGSGSADKLQLGFGAVVINRKLTINGDQIYPWQVGYNLLLRYWIIDRVTVSGGIGFFPVLELIKTGDTIELIGLGKGYLLRADAEAIPYRKDKLFTVFEANYIRVLAYFQPKEFVMTRIIQQAEIKALGGLEMDKWRCRKVYGGIGYSWYGYLEPVGLGTDDYRGEAINAGPVIGMEIDDIWNMISSIELNYYSMVGMQLRVMF